MIAERRNEWSMTPRSAAGSGFTTDRPLSRASALFSAARPRVGRGRDGAKRPTMLRSRDADLSATPTDGCTYFTAPR